MSYLQLSPAQSGVIGTTAAKFPLWLRRLLSAALPLLLLLLWTSAVRLPFYTSTDKDEFFFSVIATQWLHGGIPYVTTFDIKPPGLFFVYAAAQSVFGASLATIKGLEIVAIAIAAYTFYVALRTHASERMALWAAILFPVYTLTFGGFLAVSMVLQLPFIVASFAAALAATDEGTAPNRRLLQAFLAGLAIGAAGTVKQTAIFEALAVFIILSVYVGRGLRLRSLALFVFGAALPPAAFAAYFLAVGHFHEMFNAVIVLALQRAADDVAASYGPELAAAFTLQGAFENAVLTSVLAYFLWGSAIFAILRLDRIRKAIPTRILVIATIWFVAAFAGVVAGRTICTYYLITTMPPLLIISAALYCHGLDVAPRYRNRAFILSVIAGIASVAYLDRESLFWPNTFLAGDFNATREVSREILDLGLHPDDRLLVLNRGYAVYTETGALPPTPYFHATHLLGVFHTPVADPLATSLEANPRFIVIADPTTYHMTELAARYRQALDYVGQHYRVAGQVDGRKDSFTIYEFVR